MTVCTPWLDAADLIDDEACGARLVDVDPTNVQRGLDLATEVLYRLSGEKFPGLCTDVVRPCGRRPAGGPSWRHPVSAPTWTWDRSWGVCSHPADACGSCTLPRVALGRYPVESVDAVWIDGALLAASAYMVEDRRYLVRVDGDGWPCCQDLAGDYLTDDDTFAVEVTYGRDPDDAALVALRVYATEVALALCPGDNDCALPQRVQSITRQGVSVAVVDPLDFLDNDRTGIVLVDAWLKAVNPKGRRGAARITAPTGKPVTRLSDPAGS